MGRVVVDGVCARCGADMLWAPVLPDRLPQWVCPTCDCPECGQSLMGRDLTNPEGVCPVSNLPCEYEPECRAKNYCVLK